MSEKHEIVAKRILNIFDRLICGEVVNKERLCCEFGVKEKTIQRDIDNIRSHLSEKLGIDPNNIIKYSYKKKGYLMDKNQENVINREDVLAISKILLESRAFNKEEISHLINVVLNQLDYSNRNQIKELIGNELFNFVPLKHNEKLLSKIWDLSEDIRKKEAIEIEYIKANNKCVNRIVNPIAIIFSEYYFYLVAYFKDANLDNPAVFRIDRIKKYRQIGEKFYIPYTERFEDGEFRKRIQFMYQGKLIKIVFEFYGQSIDAVLDRLPTSKIIENNQEKYVIEAEVYGKGIIMWLLSQGKNVKVTQPQELANEIKEEINKIYCYYN